MKNSMKMSLIAAAVGGLMAGAASHAMASTPTPTVSGKAMVSTNKLAKTFAGVRALSDTKDVGKHDCKGKNDCKGQGGCKTGDAGCKGKNTCKGHGGCKTEEEAP